MANLLTSGTEGAVFSEGANFFVLSNENNKNCYAELVAIATFNTLPKEELTKAATTFLSENDLSVQDIDLLVLGNNGDVVYDDYYNVLSEALFSETPQVYYKHLCGEFNTASSFGLWLASKILKTQSVPDVVCLNELKTSKLKTVLLYNQYRGQNHSFTLVRKC